MSGNIAESAVAHTLGRLRDTPDNIRRQELAAEGKRLLGRELTPAPRPSLAPKMFPPSSPRPSYVSPRERGQAVNRRRSQTRQAVREAGQFTPGKVDTRSGGSGEYVILRCSGRYGLKRDCVTEHVWKVERCLGRHLNPKEAVHHKNGVKDDNRLENLELWCSSHPSGQRVPDLVAHAIEVLQRYSPESLRGNQCEAL